VEIAAAVEDVKYEDIRRFDAVKNDVLSYGEAAQSGTQIVPQAARARMLCEKKKPLRDGINKSVGKFKVATLGGKVSSESFQFDLDFRGKARAPRGGSYVKSRAILRALLISASFARESAPT